MADDFWGMENKLSFRVCVAPGRLSILQQTVPHAGVWGQQTLESMGYCWKKKRAPSLSRVKSLGRIKRRG